MSDNRNFIIRKVIRDDNLKLANLIRNVFDEFNAPKQNTVYSDNATDFLFETFQAPNSALWVAQNMHDNEILGCCGLYHTLGLPFDHAELVKFYIKPKARGKGIGKKLYQTTLNSAFQLNYIFLYIECFSNFYSALKIYEKLGYKYIETPLGQSGHTSCDKFLIKKI